MSQSKTVAYIKQCLAFDEMPKDDPLPGEKTPGSVRAATPLQSRPVKLFITDGPFAETKEHLGGIQMAQRVPAT